jgi:HK97 gp10 family phage protein
VANTVTVRVEGLRELGEKMRLLDAKVSKRLAGRATGKAANGIKKLAKIKIQSNPSIDTGSLLNAVIVKKIPKSQTTATSEHIVTVRGRGKPKVSKKGVKQAQAPHASLIEYGTVHMKAEPFLRPAFDNGKEAALQTIITTIRDGLK